MSDDPLCSPLCAGDRRALAKAITLIESTRADHRARADALVSALLPRTGCSVRVGLSGVPGVGKSTFIEALGVALIDRGHRVAVLAVDPSSSVTGGSILGDKTRMEVLSTRLEAFVRPSPAAGSLGGVAEHTREAVLLCEAAGYDVVIVETVGVGQSEVAVAGMTDVFVLLQLPNAGDDLQAMKKGIMELVDMVVFNKSDLDPAATRRAAAQMQGALAFLRPPAGLAPAHVLTVSALTRSGVTDFWDALTRRVAQARANGAFDARRRHQALDWMWAAIDAALRRGFRESAAVRQRLDDMAAAVEAGKVPPATAARELLALAQSQQVFCGERQHA